MATLVSHTIILKGSGLQKEAPAGAATIVPGNLVKLQSNGTVLNHGTAAANAAKAFAKENEVIGKDIDTAYASGDNVIYEVCHSGMEVYTFVAANAAAILRGDYLESDGLGGLRKSVVNAAVADTNRAGIVAVAIESLDNSAVASRARIRVEVA
jgi:hypothetical protein